MSEQKYGILQEWAYCPDCNEFYGNDELVTRNNIDFMCPKCHCENLKDVFINN